MNYVCIRSCYHDNRLWQVGDILVAEKEKCPHFKPGSPEAVKELENSIVAQDVGPKDGSEDSQSRDRAVKQCLKYNITIKPSTTLKEMRDFLATKGVTVS